MNVGDRVRVRRGVYLSCGPYARLEGRAGEITRVVDWLDSAYVRLDPRPRERAEKIVMFETDALENLQ